MPSDTEGTVSHILGRFHLTDKRTQQQQQVDRANNNTMAGDSEEDLTQGDKLMRIKAQRRHPRSLTAGTPLTGEEGRPQRRASSQPLKIAGSGGTPVSTPGGPFASSVGYASPVKSLRTGSRTPAAAVNTTGRRRSPTSPPARSHGHM